MLLALLLIPLVTAIAVAAAPEKQARALALCGTLVGLLLSIVIAVQFNYQDAGLMQMPMSIAWYDTFGLNLSLGIDSISLVLILLTTFLLPLTILGSFTAVTQRAKEFFAWLCILEAAMLGVFAARDLIVFYVCFEFTLIPMYFLIAVYGSANRAKASIWFFLYTFTGSIITLAGLVYVAWAYQMSPEGTGNWTFDIATLTAFCSEHMTAAQQGWVLLALCCGFAVKVPLFPVHTWLPLAHTEAPTAGSVVLAAVLLKLGTYGLFRFAVPMCPLAITTYAPLLAVLCIIGILYGALICWVQTDVKKLIAYSSVSHLGFCVLGLIALTSIGISGSVAYMINHGLSTGALFLCIGMIYERYHTRAMDDYSGLAKVMPVWATFTVFFILSSVGLPGLNGFIGEFLCLVGTFISGDGANPGTLGPMYAAIAGFGMILAAIYLLYLAGRVLFGPLKLPDTHHHGHDDKGDDHAAPTLPQDLTGREVLVLVPIAVACIVLGVKPGVLLAPIAAPIEQMVSAVSEAHTRHAALLIDGAPPGLPPAEDDEAALASAEPMSRDIDTTDNRPSELGRKEGLGQ
ncbi:MAG: NADH-quinone oxidoreductase subunit M [Planctomycetes bacterium]|nr:NADH-quinone oxidoreductase subunit M [Planctomycetota bacterium]NOG53003.1 NADH-quinone oxidoreductase subunit M [Planctomycetota bacterium]